jgi:hypothetical protein
VRLSAGDSDDLENGQALGAYMCAACSTFFSVVEEQERA